MSLSHGCSISYLNPHFKSRDIIGLISLWMGTIANSRAALQCSVEHAVTDEHPFYSSHPTLSFFLPPLILLTCPFCKSLLDSPAIPEFSSLPLLPLLSSLLLLIHLLLSFPNFLSRFSSPYFTPLLLSISFLVSSALYLLVTYFLYLLSSIATTLSLLLSHLSPPFSLSLIFPFSAPCIFSIWQCSACCSIVSTGACMLEMELAMAAWKYSVSSSPASATHSLTDWQTLPLHCTAEWTAGCRIVHYFVTVYVRACVWWPDFIVCLWYYRFGNHNLIIPSVFPFSLSISLHWSVCREITVLRQFLGVPPDAHIVGQRFHCHQVGGFALFCSLCLCVFFFHPVSLFVHLVILCVYAATVSHCQAWLSQS